MRDTVLSEYQLCVSRGKFSVAESQSTFLSRASNMLFVGCGVDRATLKYFVARLFGADVRNFYLGQITFP